MVYHCGLCSHPLTAHESVRRGLGPVCFRRTATVQLHDRRASVSTALAALLAEVDTMAPERLSSVQVALAEVMVHG